MSAPFFSIILPTYNRGYLIKQTIDSILDQSFENLEIIVVDDGSKDNTKEIVESISDDRIKYVYQDNAERSAARNNGIKNSVGKWICFIDSDDLFKKDHLKAFNDKIESENLNEGFLFTGYTKVKNGKEESFGNNYQGESFQDYFFRNPVNPTRVCLSKNIADKILFREDAIIVEDMIYWLEASKITKVYPIEERTAVYVMHEGNSVNAINNSYEKMYNGLMKANQDKPEILGSISKKIKEDVVSEIFFGIMKSSVINDKRLKAIKFLIKSILKAPIHVHTKHRLYVLFMLLFKSKDQILNVVHD